ncbi:MAG TPA: hypothetical protein VFV73_43305 [Streptosporangiaceae bacterium]|nr:hypothetical protein [Streptosporangiaceae bacterium]
MPGFSGVDSEVGRLRAVIVHRPGTELKPVMPRQAGQLLFAGRTAQPVLPGQP